MKLISPKIHSYLDYIIAALLIGVPWIFGFTVDGPEMWTPLIIGLIILTYSIFTRFKEEHFGIISLKTHVIFDIVLGIYLCISPWITNFSEVSPIPYVVAGVVICIIALLTHVPPKPVMKKGMTLE